MTTAADDDAFEAVLAGRPAPEGAAGLAAFTGAVRATATTPGRPNAALAELLATGLLVDQPNPSRRTAKRRRRRMWFFPALIAKIASAGAVAQAATGAGIVLVAFTGAGAAGALPGPVQDTFSSVVSSVTPLEPPTSDQTSTDSTEPADSTEVPAAETDSSETEAPATGTESPETEDSHPANFGQRVSDAAHSEDGVNGQDVSEWAHERNSERHSAGSSTAPAPTTADSGSQDSGDDSSEGASTGDSGEGDSGEGGSGHGGGHGNR